MRGRMGLAVIAGFSAFTPLAAITFGIVCYRMRRRYQKRRHLCPEDDLKDFHDNRQSVSKIHCQWMEDSDMRAYSRLALCSAENSNEGPGSASVSSTACLLPEFVAKQLDTIRAFPLSHDDVLVVSFPRSGTTWLQEIVYMIQTNLDFNAASNLNLEQRFPYLEYMYPGIRELSNRKSPRLIKSHLPLGLLPKSANNCKIIYIARNPRDVCVSYYYFHRMIKEISYNKTFSEFFDKFFSDKVIGAPWGDHVVEFWQESKRNRNMLFVKYEDLQKDPQTVIKKISEFLCKSLTSEDIWLISLYTSFAYMSTNPSSNYSWWDELGIRNQEESKFLRKGKVGDWHEHFTPKQLAKCDEYVLEHLTDSGLSFDYD